MVIGVEGNVHVGKTTYINSFKNFNIIKEIEYRKDLNDYDRQLFYIEKEKERKYKVNDKTILDRTIISTAIYTLRKFKNNEYRNLKGIIEENLWNNSFVIPDCVHYIVYPYKLICKNHTILSKRKDTQNILVDYDYYLNYSLFFSTSNSFKKIIYTKDYRQIIVYNNDIYTNVTKPHNVYPKIYNVNFIVDKIRNLKKEDKLKELNSIMSTTNLNDYATSIICDKNLEDLLIKNLGDKLKKPILLIDLFYEINESIKRGEI